MRKKLEKFRVEKFLNLRFSDHRDFWDFWQILWLRDFLANSRDSEFLRDFFLNLGILIAGINAIDREFLSLGFGIFCRKKIEEFKFFDLSEQALKNRGFNRYRRKRPKVNTSFFDLALSHTRRSDASEKRKKIACPLLNVFACVQVSSPRLYRLKEQIVRNWIFKTLKYDFIWSEFEFGSVVLVSAIFVSRSRSKQASQLTCPKENLTTLDQPWSKPKFSK